MKYFITILLIGLSLTACMSEPHHKQRQAVRNYLAELNHYVVEEINWGTPDSVFSSYPLNNIHEGKPNRIGIEFEYLLDNGGHGDLIFVFDEKGKRISHAQSLNGYYIKLYKREN